jgi:hypothetical protein
MVFIFNSKLARSWRRLPAASSSQMQCKLATFVHHDLPHVRLQMRSDIPRLGIQRIIFFFPPIGTPSPCRYVSVRPVPADTYRLIRGFQAALRCVRTMTCHNLKRGLKRGSVRPVPSKFFSSKARAAGSQPDRPHATVEEHPLGLIRGACLLSSHKSTSLGRYSSDRVQLIRPQQSLAAQLQLTHNWCHIVYRFNCPPLMAFSLRCPHWYSFPAPLSWTLRARPRQGSPKPSPL